MIENFENEIWKDIPGFEGFYQVSDKGRVKSLGNGKSNNCKARIFKLQNRGDYLAVHLCKDGKQKSFNVHRLVAEAFIPNPTDLPQVHHIDENKHNNIVSNLQWVTNKYNITFSYGKHIKCLDLNTNKVSYFLSIHEAAEYLNKFPAAISKSLNKSKKPFLNRYIFSEV